MTFKARLLPAMLPIAVAILCAALAAPAQASTSASITPTLSPNRLHAKSALTLTIHYKSGEAGLPTPVSRAVLRLPAGLSLDIPILRSCNLAQLQAHGASGCPAQSAIGH